MQAGGVFVWGRLDAMFLPTQWQSLSQSAQFQLAGKTLAIKLVALHCVNQIVPYKVTVF